jgi:hypothetical protein
MDQAGPAGDGDVPAGTGDGPAAPASSLAVTDGEHTAADVSSDGENGAPSGPRATGWRSAGGRWGQSPVARHLAIFIGFLAAGVLFGWPRGSYLFDHRLPDTRDAASFVWGFYWVAHQVAHLSNPWFTNYIAAPVGTQLGFHTLMPLPGLVMTPITLAFGPSASYNLLSALMPGVLAYAMYRVGRLWLPSQTGAIAAGAFFGLSSMLTNQSWYELNLAMGALFIPLGLEAAVRLRRRPGWRQAVILGVIEGAALLTDQESAILASFAVVLALLPWLIFGPSRASTDPGSGPGAQTAGGLARARAILARLRPVVLAALVMLVVASPQIIAMGAQAAAGNASFPPTELAHSYVEYGAGLLGLVAPSPRIASYGLDKPASFFYKYGIINPGQRFSSGLTASYTPMFGVMLSILAIAGLVISYRRRNAWLLALLAVGCGLLALGPVLWIGRHPFVPFAQEWDTVRVSLLMPYTWLVRMPGMSNFREAARFLELGLAGLALLAGSTMDWLRRHSKAALAVVAVLSLFELGWAGNPPTTVMPHALRIGTMPTSMPDLDGPIAADHSSSIVVDFPFGIRGGPPVYGPGYAPESEVLATADHHPLADALISRVSGATISGIESHPFYVGLNDVIHRPKHMSPASYDALVRAAAQDARRMNVGWVIVWPTKVPRSIERYLTGTGFRLDYRIRNIQVWHR